MAETESVDVRGLMEDVALNAGLHKVKLKDDENEETLLDQSVQMRPGQEFCVIICEDKEEWGAVQKIFALKQVRRGGYKKGSPFDDTSTERIITAERLFNLIASLGGVGQDDARKEADLGEPEDVMEEVGT